MKKRFTEKLSIGFLKHAEAGVPVKELRRTHGFGDASFYIWRVKVLGQAFPRPSGCASLRPRVGSSRSC